jgi:hypothetical protein
MDRLTRGWVMLWTVGTAVCCHDGMACGPPCNGNGGWWIYKDGKPERWVSCPKCAVVDDDDD